MIAIPPPPDAPSTPDATPPKIEEEPIIAKYVSTNEHERIKLI